ncbi:MAG TPA: TonB-dependent receptor, partial [Acidobacteriaceae bacterium]|nr:TonB-dependent receptor [Acidobacteriaceae bacterium]
VFYSGGNSALNALPFSVTGAPVVQPPYNSNSAGLVFVGPPQIPGLLKPSTSNFMFLGLFITRNSNPFNQYATVPTLAERGGDFSQFTGTGTGVVPIYDPATGQQFSGNRIPAGDINQQAQALLQYIPLPNQPGAQQNFQYLTTAQTNSTRVGMRFTHNFGSAGGGGALPQFLRNFMGQANHGLTQNVNVNFNFSHGASDLLNVFPQLGGANQSYQYSINAGYVLGYNRWTFHSTANLNRSNTQASNFFTGHTDVAGNAGIQGLGTNPFNFGVPNAVFSQFSGMNEQAPSYRLDQTITGAENIAWTGKQHNLRFGGDFRRIHLNLQGGTNVTGSFYFTGFATQKPNSPSTPGQATSGADLADFLLGLPQEATVQQGSNEFYLRANVWDLFVQDDWHARANFTVNMGLRYEYYSPYSEKEDRLATLDFTPNLDELSVVLPNGVGPVHGKYPRSLVYPDRKNFSPRIGFAWRPVGTTVVRGGYGINYNTGQYANFIQRLAYQPPFATSLTNIVPAESAPTLNLATALVSGTTPSGITNNFAVNPNYLLGYVQVWNLDIQNTLPKGIVLNVGYNGAKGTHLDLVDAPNRQLTGLLNPAYPSFNYEDSLGFSNFNALAVRVRKRLQNGVSLGATYTYAHSIDNASSIGGSTSVVAQNQQDLLAEVGNSSFDIRHQVTGDWLYELPFGPDTRFLTGGSWLSHALSNFSISGTFNFATGAPLSPNYSATSADVARGSAGSQRPNRIPGTSLTATGGTLQRWFNLSAFSPPVDPVTGAPVYGNASRNSIPGPGTMQENMSLSKTMHFGGTRSLELRGTANNVFNTVQYATVNSSIDSLTAGQVTSAANMRQITVQARFRY